MSLTPVSYTHLDVCKRQVCVCVCVKTEIYFIRQKPEHSRIEKKKKKKNYYESLCNINYTSLNDKQKLHKKHTV